MISNMETNDIKKIWKAGVEGDIKPYSNSELNKMVVNTARKSISRVYPSVIFRLVIIAVIVLLIINITLRDSSAAMRILDLSVLLILSVYLTLWGQSYLIMKKYKASEPIKKWLEYRMAAIEKDLNFNTKYYLLICTIALLAALGYYYFFIWLSNIFVNLWIVGGVTVGITIYILVAQRSVTKNYKKTLRELKDLYNQLEE